jgi:hypothetical protein
MKKKIGKKVEKVGTSPEAAKRVGGKGDFGAPESNPIERQYASEAIKHQDKGGAPEHSRGDGVRVSGVGGNDSGPGSSSGGDIDLDVIGFERNGPPEENRTNRKIEVGKQPPMQGSTVDRSGGDVSTTNPGQGSAAVTNPAEHSDAFAGEISMDEASGADNSPSDNL